MPRRPPPTTAGAAPSIKGRAKAAPGESGCPPPVSGTTGERRPFSRYVDVTARSARPRRPAGQTPIIRSVFERPRHRSDPVPPRVRLVGRPFGPVPDEAGTERSAGRSRRTATPWGTASTAGAWHRRRRVAGGRRRRRARPRRAPSAQRTWRARRADVRAPRQPGRRPPAGGAAGRGPRRRAARPHDAARRGQREGSPPIPGPPAVAPRPGPQGQPGRGANGDVPLALRGEARALYARPAPARPEVLSCVAPAPASIAAPSSS